MRGGVKCHPFLESIKMDLFTVHNNLSVILSNWDKYVDDFIKKFYPDFIDINTDQLDDSQKADGTLMQGLRSEAYARAKKSMGGVAPFGQPDLKFTGSFRDSRVIKAGTGEFEIIATDEKTSDLLVKYGDVLGLQRKRIDQFISDQLIPAFESQLLKDMMS